MAIGGVCCSTKKRKTVLHVFVTSTLLKIKNPFFQNKNPIMGFLNPKHFEVNEVNLNVDYCCYMKSKDSKPVSASWKSCCTRVVAGGSKLSVSTSRSIITLRLVCTVLLMTIIKCLEKYFTEAFGEECAQKVWIHPPYDVFPQAIEKIIQNGAKGFVTCPLWKSESWFPELQKMHPSSFRRIVHNHDPPLPQQDWLAVGQRY